MEIILSCVVLILFLLGAVFLIASIIIRIVIFFKCRVSLCRNRRCIFQIICWKYSSTATEEELDEVLKMVNDYKKKLFEKRRMRKIDIDGVLEF